MAKITINKNKNIGTDTLAQFTVHILVIKKNPGTLFTTIHFLHIWAQYVGLLHYIRQERLLKDKHSILFGPFASYEENVML